MKTAHRASYAAVRDAAREAIVSGRPGEWTLPAGGALVLHGAPAVFLIAASDAPLRRLAGGASAWMVMPSTEHHRAGVDAVLATVLAELVRKNGALCVIAVRGAPTEVDTELSFEVTARPSARWDPYLDELAAALRAARTESLIARVEVVREVPSPAAVLTAVPLRPPSNAERVLFVDLAIGDVWLDPTSGAIRPLLFEEVRRALLGALESASRAFVHRYIQRARPPTPLGTAVVCDAARECDTILCDAANAFEMLVQLTPENLEQAWRRLLETDFQEPPVFRYTPLPLDPVMLKRRVYEAPVDAIDDPFVADLMREKQEELDRMISMLRDRGETFLHESAQLFGRPDEPLLDLARRILAADHAREPSATLSSAEIIERAREHMRGYRDQDPLFPDELEVREGIAAGLMVSRGRLLLRPDIELSEARLDALLEHEIGTHVVTWFNGSAQPLRVLGTGLARYEALQEGLAVLAEHLAGGIDAARMRVLAARVLAAHAVATDCSFLELFHLLESDLGLPRRTAFQTAVRAMRGGGMTKDLAYMRGLLEVVEHVRAGGELEPLYVGKIAISHLPTITALRERGLLSAPLVLPNIVRNASPRLDALRRAPSAAHAVLAMTGDTP